MAKLTLTTFLTLDGVMQAPGGPTEDTTGAFAHGGWLAPYLDAQGAAFVAEVFGRAGAFLLGRKTYDIFAGYWPFVSDAADPIATALNRLPKYVASRKLARVDWEGSTVIRDVARDVPRLKDELEGELQVHGSGGLAQTLLHAGLIDELTLLVFPVALGRGKRLFAWGTVPTAFEALGTRTTGKGVTITTLRRVGRPTYGDLGEPSSDGSR